MEISVIVTIYNREKYLRECLDSLVNQTFEDFEVLMIDDGSTDNSKSIAQEYADKDQRFKLIASEHIGYPAAKNLGLDKAQGKYIIFLDSDDSAYPQWLGILYTTALNTDADIASCYYDEYYGDKKAREPDSDFYLSNPIQLTEATFLKMNLLYYRMCSSYNWNKLIKREVYEGIRFRDQVALSDISEGYKIFDKANKVVHIHFPLVHYRRHKESIGYESTARGLVHHIFRADVLEETGKFTWEHYPQSRYTVQCMLKNELERLRKQVTNEEFIKYIDRPFFKEVFSTQVAKYIIR